jgi:sugar diacid utilization regulator
MRAPLVAVPAEPDAPRRDDLRALAVLAERAERGDGLHAVVREAARALRASLAVLDRAGLAIAVAARSPTEERALLGTADPGAAHPLRVAGEEVGLLRLRPRDGAPPEPDALRLACVLLAAELERVHGPRRASAEALAELVQALLARRLAGRDEILARAGDLGLDLSRGGCVLVARVHPQAPTDEAWRARVLALAERGARAAAARAVAAPGARQDGAAAEIVLLLPGADDPGAARAADAVLRELEAMPGARVAVGRSRPAPDPTELHRAGHEALLAANVADGGPDGGQLAFEETGAYRLLLRAMSKDPAELQRFYAETVEPLVAYDQQYETDLVQTLETFLEADGNVAGTAQRLFTHRHTVRYRLERVRELSGLDVGSTDGRERLSLGLKAMRVLGISAPTGPATELGTGAGRVPRGHPRDR